MKVYTNEELQRRGEQTVATQKKQLLRNRLIQYRARKAGLEPTQDEMTKLYKMVVEDKVDFETAAKKFDKK